jgi:hypothetical protein
LNIALENALLSMNELIENALGVLLSILPSKTLYYYIYAVENYLKLVPEKLFRKKSTKIELVVESGINPSEAL